MEKNTQDGKNDDKMLYCSGQYDFNKEQTTVVVFEWDLASDTLTYSGKWNERLGSVPNSANAGNYITNFPNIHPEDVPAFKALMECVEKGVAYSALRLRICGENGEYTWHQMHVITQYGTEKKPVKIILIVFDINEEMKAFESLRFRAEQDALTGLLNREETEARIKQYLHDKPDKTGALFMIDTDNFKQINDSRGHTIGDIVLAEIAAAMKRLIQNDGIVGRIGGDEFAIFMQDISSREKAENTAEELTEMFRHLFENEKQVVQVTCSVGVSLYPENGVDFISLYRCADQALYQAKEKGKNCFVFYDRNHTTPVEDTGYSSLGAAIDSEQRSVGVPGDLISIVFKILYEMMDIDQAVNLILEIVGKRYDVSRAYIFEMDEDNDFCSNSYEWCNEGIVPEKDQLQNINAAEIGYSELFGKDSIFYCRDTGTLPEGPRELLENQGIHSTLQCALWEDDEETENGKIFGGFVGFDECTGRRLWTREETSTLSVISEILTTFLLKQRLQERNRSLIAREKEVARIEAEQRKAAEQSIVECIQWLSSAEYLEDAIDYVLRIVQDYYRSERVYIIETDEVRGIASNTYEICAAGITPQIEQLQDVPIETISFWMEQFKTHDYVKIDDVDSLEEDRQMEREVLKAQNINSLMAVPLHMNGSAKGFLGIDNPGKHKDEIQYLMELSFFLSNEIAKKTLQKSLKQMSYADSMTGLENRNSYTEYCDDFLLRSPVPVGIVFMDINGLKRLNDTRGHVCGDLLIIYIADMMKKFFPDSRKFRLSGDEFLIVTEKMPYDEFKQRLDDLESVLSEEKNNVVSVGTTWSDVEANLDELRNRADRLMYINKRDYYRDTEAIAFEKLPMLKGLTEAILDKKYFIYLQPKLNLKTGKADSAEVLVRYREQDGSVSAPVKFIPLLEKEGLISQIDFFVMEEVCRLLTKWKDTSLSGMKLALNFSRITLFDSHFMERFLEIFMQYDLRPDQLEVEITETQESLNKRQMALLLEQLKKHGFCIALDDFGVEYSSYEFLMMAGFDMMKIDKEIIQKYEVSSNGETLLKHIVNMSHAIGSLCCAEGVETESQLQFMKEIGCDYVQGYLIDRPMSAEQFELKYR